MESFLVGKPGGRRRFRGAGAASTGADRIVAPQSASAAVKLSSPATREFWEVPVLFEDTGETVTIKNEWPKNRRVAVKYLRQYAA